MKHGLPPAGTPRVIRRWNRDGSTNVMSLAAAVENLVGAAVYEPGTKRPGRDTIAEQLVAGYVFFTKYAELAMEMTP